MRVFLTGGTGFIGQALIKELLEQKFDVIAAVRSASSNVPSGTIKAGVTGLFEVDDPQYMLGVDVLIHCAGRAHVLDEEVADPLEAFRQINTVGTLNIARQAVDAGVQRFVFISSIGVMGNNNKRPFVESDVPAPHEAYAVSKYEAELGLQLLSKETGMEVVIIRPPLVYGPGAPGNFGRLVRWVSKGVSLPFGSVHNLRSLVALDNLVSFIILCADFRKSPRAANETFLVSDNEDVSTTKLLRKTANAFGKKTRLIPVPVIFMTAFLRLTGRADMANRLFGSLRVDSSKTRELLQWCPVISMDAQLKKIADRFDSASS